MRQLGIFGKDSIGKAATIQNLTAVSGEMRKNIVKEQTGIGFSSTNPKTSSLNYPSAENLKAYYLSKNPVSFGCNPEHVKQARGIIKALLKYSKGLISKEELEALRNLEGFDLSKANLQEQNFLKAKLPLANLQGSDLRGSFITHCPTNPELSTNLKGATYNTKTRFPKSYALIDENEHFIPKLFDETAAQKVFGMEKV